MRQSTDARRRSGTRPRHFVATLVRRVALGSVSLLGMSGCSISDLVNQSNLPPEFRDPTALHTPEGAVAAYQSALLAFTAHLASKNPTSDSSMGSVTATNPSFIYVVGLLTDELSLVLNSSVAQNGFATSPEAAVDSRSADDNDFSATALTRGFSYDAVFKGLQTIRSRARDARGALTLYAPEMPSAFRGHLYAVEAYAELLLAELYCSGIPLGGLEFGGGMTYTRGYTTGEILQHSMQLFDSAIVLVQDSARIRHFVNMGRGRALLGLGQYAEAAHTVADVPDDYQYQLIYPASRINFFQASAFGSNRVPANVGHREGINGLPFWDDPRSDTVRTYGQSTFNFIPRKFILPGTTPTTVTVGGVTYPQWINQGTTPIPIATGIEARLIEAEAALKAGDANWLTILNRLRTSCTSVGTCPAPAPAGAGGVAGLPPLTSPPQDSAKVSLLFRERAYWLFLTGYRVGDLRRMVRQYGRLPESVFPIGPWGPGVIQFGSDVNAPVPFQEQQFNTRYRGCENRDA